VYVAPRAVVTLDAIGGAAGIASSLYAARWIEPLLYEVSATDPVTPGGAGVLLAVVALVGCYLPGRRAARVHPVAALLDR
jgi:putative ABC transport system permease protein